MAIAIRAAIEAMSPLLAVDRGFDTDHYPLEIVTAFDLATRVEAWQCPRRRGTISRSYVKRRG